MVMRNFSRFEKNKNQFQLIRHFMHNTTLVERSQNNISYFTSLFPFCIVKIFHRSYGYASKFCLAGRKNESKISETLFYERTTRACWKSQKSKIYKPANRRSIDILRDFGGEGNFVLWLGTYVLSVSKKKKY